MKLKKRIDNAPAGMDLSLDVENLLEHFFGDRVFGNTASTNWAPRVNVSENETAFQIDMELAGVNPDNVNVEMKEGRLEIWGEKKVETQQDGVKFLRTERYDGTFRRAFEFPTQVDADRIEAEFKHGVLSVVLPKSEKVLPRKIEVKVSG